MDANRAIAPEALAHARLAGSVALVPRTTIAEMFGLTVSEYRRDRGSLGIPTVRRGPRISRSSRRRASPQREAASRGARNRPAPFEAPAGWPSQDAAVREIPVGAVSAASPIDRLAVGRAMERFIASRVAAYEAAGGDDPEPEKTARTIGHYARALGLVRGYLADIEKDAETHDEAPARSLSDLRDELRRRLERLWDESRDAGGMGQPSADAPRD